MKYLAPFDSEFEPQSQTPLLQTQEEVLRQLDALTTDVRSQVVAS